MSSPNDSTSANTTAAMPLAQDDDVAAGKSGWRLGEFYREIFRPFLLTRLALVLVGWMALNSFTQTPRPGAWEINRRGEMTPLQGPVSGEPHPFVNMWSRWDAGWYIGIARDGYQFSPDRPSNAAFFPAYPMAIRGLHLLVHSRRAIWWFVTGIVVSNGALLVALAYFYQLIRLEFDRSIARRAVLYLLIFPTTLFLSAVYSESLFLAFLISSFYYARRGRWWWAGLLGCGATMCRPPGIVLLVGLAVEYAQQCEFNWRKIRPNILALAIVPLGLASFLAYLHFAQGSANAATDAQYTWGLKLKPLWETLAPFFRSELERRGTVVDLLFTFGFAALTFMTVFRQRASYAAFCVAGFIFITLWGSLESVPRYGLGLFPVITTLALAGKREGFDRVYVPVSAALAAVLMAAFAVWGWVA